jgi:hypothetical protein
VGGFNFAGNRGNVTASIQRSQLDGLLATDIPRFAESLAYTPNPSPGVTGTQTARRPDNDGRVNGNVPFSAGPNDGIPNAVLIRSQRMAAVTFGGLAFPTGANNLSAPDNRMRCFGATATTQGTCLQFSPGGDLVAYDPGSNFGLTSASGGDGIRPADMAPAMTDLTRTSATVITSSNGTTIHGRHPPNGTRIAASRAVAATSPAANGPDLVSTAPAKYSPRKAGGCGGVDFSLVRTAALTGAEVTGRAVTNLAGCPRIAFFPPTSRL